MTALFRVGQRVRLRGSTGRAGHVVSVTPTQAGGCLVVVRWWETGAARSLPHRADELVPVAADPDTPDAPSAASPRPRRRR